jgi:hypothetical protein
MSSGSCVGRTGLPNIKEAAAGDSDYEGGVVLHFIVSKWPNFHHWPMNRARLPGYS